MFLWQMEIGSGIIKNKNLFYQKEVFMKLFVARHGQTAWNAQNKVCGITDVKKKKKGIEQAKELADIVKKHNIDTIISSPLNEL